MEIERDPNPHDTVMLPFVRPVPPEWADALYWFRIGSATPKDEAGIVNLWTAAEVLAEQDPHQEGSNLQRVLRSVGVMSSVFLVYEEQLYLAQAARQYALRWGLPAGLDVPENQANLLIPWWIELATHRSLRELEERVFRDFPQLAFEASKVKRISQYGEEMYLQHKAVIDDNLAWLYACRNDVVHEGRQCVPGAVIARRLLAEYVSLTLRRSLAMKARRGWIDLSECFYLARENEAVLLEKLLQHDLVGGLLSIYA